MSQTQTETLQRSYYIGKQEENVTYWSNIHVEDRKESSLSLSSSQHSLLCTALSTEKTCTEWLSE